MARIAQLCGSVIKEKEGRTNGTTTNPNTDAGEGVSDHRSGKRSFLESINDTRSLLEMVLDTEPRTLETPIIEQRHGTPNRRAFMQMVLGCKDERVFPRRLSVSLKVEQASGCSFSKHPIHEHAYETYSYEAALTVTITPVMLLGEYTTYGRAIQYKTDLL